MMKEMIRRILVEGGDKEDENKKNKERKSNKKITLEFTFDNSKVTKVSIDEINGKKEINKLVQESGRNGGDICLFRVDDKDLGKELINKDTEIEIKDKDKLPGKYLISFVQMAKKYNGGGGYYILYSSNCQSADNRGLFDSSGIKDDNAFQCNITAMKLFECSSNVTDMSFMFYKCSSLKNLDLSRFDTSNVTNMKAMFYECKKLEGLDLSKFDASNVTNMNCMFCTCKDLGKIIFGNNFDTSKVTNMRAMFSSCSSLTNLNLSKFNTGKVTSMEAMFGNCISLINLDLSNFDTSKVTNMKNMFYECSSLKTIEGGNNFKISEECGANDIAEGASDEVIGFINKKKKQE